MYAIRSYYEYARIVKSPDTALEILLVDGKNISASAKNAVGYATELKPKMKQIRSYNFV